MEQNPVPMASIMEVKRETCSGHIFQLCPHCKQDENNGKCPNYRPILPPFRPRAIQLFNIQPNDAPS